MKQTYFALLVGMLLVLTVVLTSAVAFGSVGADSETPSASSAESTIDVSAVGEVTAPPDRGIVRLSLSVAGNDIDTLNDELAADAEALRHELDQLDVAYETTSYRIGETRIRGDERHEYEGRHSFEVTTDEPDRVGPVIDAAASVGAEIDAVELTLSDETEAALRDAAIEDAMQDARDQAETIAAMDALELSHAASVDASQRFNFFRLDAAAEGQADAAELATKIEREEVSLTYDVDVTYNATLA